MTGPHRRPTRRDCLKLTLLACMSTSASIARATAPAPADGWILRDVTIARPIAQIRRGEAGTLLAVDLYGGLWSCAATGIAQQIGEGIDPETPVCAGQGRVVARSRDGKLWVRSDGDRRIEDVVLAPRAGFAVLPFAIIAIVVDGSEFRVVRFEPADGRWSETDRSGESILPDARPIVTPLGHASGDALGELVVFAGPDADRYDHGVLGDRIEPTRLLWLDRHSLQTRRALALPAPYVFEDIAPRPIAYDGGTALLTMRSGGAGTSLAVVATDPADARGLRIAALGPPLDGPHRWMAPTTDGKRLVAVHTPHAGGVLTEYRVDGAGLTGATVADGVANHRIHTRELDLSIWLGTTLIVPSQDRRRLRVFEPANRWRERPGLPVSADVVMTAPIDGARFAVLLEDGTAIVARRS